MICLINGLNRHYGKLQVCRVLNLCQVHCFGQTCCHVYLGLCRVHWHMANSLCPVVRGYKTNLYLLTGAAAFCWAIWMTRNEVVFDKYRPKTFLQVLFKRTYWLWFWAKLERGESHQELLILACRSLEMAALHFFTLNGWSFDLRIGFWVIFIWSKLLLV